MSNIKNYAKQGGDRWVVNGVLEITSDGQLLIDGLPLIRSNNQANSIATNVAGLKDDFNALLTKLKSAGLMKSD